MKGTPMDKFTTLKDLVEENALEKSLQEYLENHSTVLIDAVANPFWAFNYVMPHFKLGSDLIPDFLIMSGQSNSYFIKIIELKRPGDRLFNKNKTISKQLNIVNTQLEQYTHWIEGHLDEFKKILHKGLSMIDKEFSENFSWTRRFVVEAYVIIGRRNENEEELKAEKEKPDYSIVSYDRLVDIEKRIHEMESKGVPNNLFDLDYWIKEKYGVEIDSPVPPTEHFGEYYRNFGDE